MRREVASVVVSCIFSSEDCPWKGEVRHFEAHTVGCDFQKVKCVHPECGKFVKRISLSYHVESECKFRLVACELCQSQVVFRKLQVRCLLGVGSLLKKHINSGSDVALSCAKFFYFLKHSSTSGQNSSKALIIHSELLHI